MLEKMQKFIKQRSKLHGQRIKKIVNKHQGETKIKQFNKCIFGFSYVNINIAAVINWGKKLRQLLNVMQD